MPYTVVASDLTSKPLVDGSKVAQPLLNEIAISQAKFDRAVTDMTDAAIKIWLDGIVGSPTLTRAQMTAGLYALLKAGADVV